MIDAAVMHVLPDAPPTQFERQLEHTAREPWVDESQGIQILIGRGFSENWSSSSSQGTLQNLSRIWLESPAQTTSSSSLVESLAGLLAAEKSADSVISSAATENVFEIRRLTGFTWQRVADLLNVERRTVNNWIRGSKIRSKNLEHIAETLSVLRFADRGLAEENAAELDKQFKGEVTPFEEIKAGRYLNAKQHIGHGVARASASWRNTAQNRTFVPLLSHPSADGLEEIETLPNEPTPTGRKRKIKRV